MSRKRIKISIRGVVQGVGFRPFVYRAARQRGLSGAVRNSAAGVVIEAEGAAEELESFLICLPKEKPPRAIIQSLEFSILDPVGHADFNIEPSDPSGQLTALILPDIATCPDCVREIFDPADRRYLYPFTNCTSCGPRFSILQALPYDRGNTSMRRFTMCAACEREYNDPHSRRFHAEPNACPDCGPHLAFWDGSGQVLSIRQQALREAAHAVRAGKILALKGIGGFQLIADARNGHAVEALRRRKHREEKPFAVMFPSLESLRCECRVSELEQRLLLSPESPIVLLDRIPRGAESSDQLSPLIAPNNPALGVMLPYSPLHHLLLRELGFPIVATSGNLSEEPICIDESEARSRLHGIADCFLVHDRPIQRPVDDSVARMILGRELVLRRARGYAPLPVPLDGPGPSILAVGAQLKNTVALRVGDQVFISQHVGDLANQECAEAFRQVGSDLQRLYRSPAQVVARDLHPDYFSSQYAERLNVPVVPVQHHYAHVLACMTENELQPPVLGICWDGTGLGLDHTIWGGEFLVLQEQHFGRVGHLRPFRLPGGEAAIKQPRRCALGILYELFGEALFEGDSRTCLEQFSQVERSLLKRMLKQGLNCPVTSSVGRLFDAVASLVGLRQRTTFEGQAAMELEFAASSGIEEHYPAVLLEPAALTSQRLHPSADECEPPGTATWVCDWRPMVQGILRDVHAGLAIGLIAAKFHNALVEMAVEVATRVGQEKVLLSGGCFQNKYLLVRLIQRLQQKAFKVYWHQRIPPNDGGIALGQVAAAARVQQPKVEPDDERLATA